MNKFEQIKNSFDLLKKQMKENFNIKYISLIIIYIIALFPLFRANFFYEDDIARGFSGYRDFGFGRVVSDKLSILVHTSKYISDISPFTQILASVILIISSIILIKIINQNIKSKNVWKYIIAVIPVGLSPFFLSNLSYKFDSPYMALSIFVSIVPFLFYKDNVKIKENLLFLISSIISSLLMATTYQASSGIFLVLIVVLAVQFFIKDYSSKEIGKFILLSLMGYIIGLLIYKLLFIKTVKFDGYVNNEFLEFKDLLPGIINNYKKYYEKFIKLFNVKWIISIIVLNILAIINLTIKSKRNKIVTAVLSFLSMIIIALLSFGIYPVLKVPIFHVRAMYGIGINIAIISLLAVDIEKSYLSNIIVVFLTYSFLVIAMMYGNALYEQNRYTNYKITLIAQELNELNVDEKIDLYFEGNIGFSPNLKNLRKKNSLIEELVPVLLGESKYIWRRAYFFNYFGFNNINALSVKPDKSKMQLYKHKRYYDIYKKDNVVLIELKDD